MMRFVIPILALSLAAGQALAQTPAAPATPASAAPTEAAPATPAPQVTKPAHPRMTFTQRFEAANTSHDGHLTKDQAQAAHMTATVRHFAAIDKEHKGYVTLDDLRAYTVAQRVRHHTATKTPPA